ncbi:Chaperone protein HscB [hydrothermal vent metagenome]|uniref:Chaperone protein HscB n=1 Tax=hydrothermal vent metagenome TaxID=652676 RepID=A0A3B1AX99_9ZZZZ
MLDFSKNYFELFGLPVAFEVDGAELASCYRDLQRVVHPDRYASVTEQEKRLSMQSSTHLNDALDTLQRPLSRAKYMLELQGVDLAVGAGSISDGDFLMEQMELREELADVKGQVDPYAALANLMKRIDADTQGLLKDIGEQLELSSPESLEQAKETVNKLQFLSRISAQVEELEADLDEAL